MGFGISHQFSKAKVMIFGGVFLEQSDLGIPQTGCSAGSCWPS